MFHLSTAEGVKLSLIYVVFWGRVEFPTILQHFQVFTFSQCNTVSEHFLHPSCAVGFCFCPFPLKQCIFASVLGTREFHHTCHSRLRLFFFFLIYFFLLKDSCFTEFFVFCQTSVLVSHRYTYIPSLLNFPPISLPIPPL